MAEQTKKRSVTTDEETWNWNWSEVQKKHLQLLIIAIGAPKDEEMKIFEITTLNSVKRLHTAPWVK